MRTSTRYIPVSSFLLAAAFSGSALAVNSDNNTAVASAFTAGGTAVASVVTGVIALAAAMTGLGLIYKWLSK